ncbi:MAG TPA: hypothetical protein VF883_22475, partial [Thermoanaerobaculia bacterium]
MKTLSVVLFLFLAVLPSFAQTDVAVTFAGEERVAGFRMWLGVGVTSTGRAENVVLEIDVPAAKVYPHEWQGTECTEGRPIRCTIETLPSASDYGTYLSLVFEKAGTYAVTARVTSTMADPDLSNNSATRSVVITGLPDLRPYGRAKLDEGYAIDPGGKGEVVVGVQNDGAPATDAIVRAILPEGGRFLVPDEWTAAHCTVVSDTEARCNFGDAIPGIQYALPFVAPERADGGTFP